MLYLSLSFHLHALFFFFFSLLLLARRQDSWSRGRSARQADERSARGAPRSACLCARSRSVSSSSSRRCAGRSGGADGRARGGRCQAESKRDVERGAQRDEAGALLGGAAVDALTRRALVRFARRRRRRVVGKARIAAAAATGAAAGARQPGRAVGFARQPRRGADADAGADVCGVV